MVVISLLARMIFNGTCTRVSHVYFEHGTKSANSHDSSAWMCKLTLLSQFSCPSRKLFVVPMCTVI